ncbi:TPA: 23S rRNA (pseudouridine(1915)-N(3))-methyltransferase RlmH [Candidatus Avigastranaerophilus faecigallinarum]|nr:23S rRNA (pseudouridine(1915)-N(3))-methyltransferase RlmH [Candidatus Avigastranaerophilus faecigallinarum]
MNIKVIAVGKIKEQYLKDAIKEYEKRLISFCSFSVIEVVAEQINDESLCEKYKEIEADRILQNIKKNSFIITLEIKGKSFTSEAFAQKIKDISNEGINDVVFIIGGANGLHKKVSDIGNMKISFSQMTFTHQMIRVLLIEQIYRAFKINANEPYHR